MNRQEYDESMGGSENNTVSIPNVWQCRFFFQILSFALLFDEESESQKWILWSGKSVFIFNKHIKNEWENQEMWRKAESVFTRHKASSRLASSRRRLKMFREDINQREGKVRRRRN